MILAYVDESYTDDFYYIAALLCPETVVNQLAADLDDVVAKAVDKYGLNAKTELHGYDLFSGKADWKPMRNMLRARLGVADDAYEVIGRHDLRLVLRGLDVKALQRRYAYPDPPHAIVLQHVMERVNTLARRDGTHALVIADEVQEQDEHRAAFSRYRRSGTPGYLSSDLGQIVDTIYFAPSSYSRLLQAVDLVAYLHRRRETIVEPDVRAKAFSERLWGYLEPHVAMRSTWVP